MQEPIEPGLLGSQAGQPTSSASRLWTDLHRAGDIGLALFSVILILPGPSLRTSLVLLSLAFFRLRLGPKFGVAAILAGMLAFVFLSLQVIEDTFFVRSCHPITPLGGCKSNLKNIATACEMYSTDNGGRYPYSLEQLTPSYLKALPTCPAAERETYSDGYRRHALPDTFTIDCRGLNHQKAGITAPNYPMYDNTNGLCER